MSAVAGRVAGALALLKKHGSQRTKDQARNQFGIVAPKSFGVTVGTIQKLGKQFGRDHELALALWDTGWYEARLLCAFVDEPERVTAAQMDRWARDFDNWGIVDTVCFKLFDQAAPAWRKVEPWCKRKEEFVRRAGFVLLACLAAHDKEATDAQFLKGLRLIEAGAGDERNFVKKGALWALRAIGGRSKALNIAALATARTLAESDEASARWIGKTALREITKRAAKRPAKTKRTGT